MLFFLAGAAMAASPAPAGASSGAPPKAPPKAIESAPVLPTTYAAAASWLAAEAPLLVGSLAARNLDGDAILATARVLAAADPRLVDLLVPAAPDGPLVDTTGGRPELDLLDADVWLEGTTLVGVVRGHGVAEQGVWLDLDLEDGPAADLQLGFGRGWTRATPLDGGPVPVSGPYPTVDGDSIAFTLDLADSGRPARGYAGAVTARVRSLDGLYEDPGPGGLLGPAPDEAVDVLLALTLDDTPVADPDLAVALAVTFGAVRPLVTDDVVATVDADALAWLRYGEGLDTWLAAAGAQWRFADLDAFGLLTWAWPAAQAIVYGAVPLATQADLLDADHYRFVVPDVGTLATLRTRAPVAPTAAETARAVDAAINGGLRYRAHDTLMAELCRTGARTDTECKGWEADLLAKTNLGQVGEHTVHLWEGVSATWQVGVFRRYGTYVGDCATATGLTIATLQALGIPAIGMGWSGEDLTTPTHDVPLWYDGATFRATQRGPGPSWARSSAFVYVTLPAVHPVNAWTLAREPGAWSRGGAVAGGWTTYGRLTQVLRDGLPGRVVGSWVDTQANGGWPSW
jgi:hypothetical protein